MKERRREKKSRRAIKRTSLEIFQEFDARRRRRLPMEIQIKNNRPNNTACHLKKMAHGDISMSSIIACCKWYYALLPDRYFDRIPALWPEHPVDMLEARHCRIAWYSKPVGKIFYPKIPSQPFAIDDVIIKCNCQFIKKAALI